MATPEHPDVADHELLGASDEEEMAGAGGTLTALLPSLRDYNTSLPLHGTAYVNAQGRKHFPACFSSRSAGHHPTLLCGT